VSANNTEFDFVFRLILPGRVGEWLKPADCKSAAPCGLRRFESFPVHQICWRDVKPTECRWGKWRKPLKNEGRSNTAGKIAEAMFKSGTVRGV
jgi:hypothetical protein